MSDHDKPPDIGNLGDALRNLLEFGQKVQPFVDGADLIAQRKRAGKCVKCGDEPIARPGGVFGATCERAAAHGAVDALLDGGLDKAKSILDKLKQRKGSP